MRLKKESNMSNFTTTIKWFISLISLLLKHIPLQVWLLEYEPYRAYTMLHDKSSLIIIYGAKLSMSNFLTTIQIVREKINDNNNKEGSLSSSDKKQSLQSSAIQLLHCSLVGELLNQKGTILGGCGHIVYLFV